MYANYACVSYSYTHSMHTHTQIHAHTNAHYHSKIFCAELVRQWQDRPMLRHTIKNRMKDQVCPSIRSIPSPITLSLYLSLHILARAVSALRFIGCHNQSELYLRARDQSCLSDHSCLYILEMYACASDRSTRERPTAHSPPKA